MLPYELDCLTNDSRKSLKSDLLLSLSLLLLLLLLLLLILLLLLLLLRKFFT